MNTNASRASGRVWLLGADIDTDVLAPGAYMKHGLDVIATHCLESVCPEFAASVQRGDVVVAGPNFGIGSSREQAAGALVHLGVAAVIAPSFGGLFFRNAFNLGLLLLTCEQAQHMQEGEHIQWDVSATASAVIRADGTHLPAAPVPDFLMDMVRAGGLLPMLKQRTSRGSHA